MDWRGIYFCNINPIYWQMRSWWTTCRWRSRSARERPQSAPSPAWCRRDFGGIYSSLYYHLWAEGRDISWKRAHIVIIQICDLAYAHIVTDFVTTSHVHLTISYGKYVQCILMHASSRHQCQDFAHSVSKSVFLRITDLDKVPIVADNKHS